MTTVEIFDLTVNYEHRNYINIELSVTSNNCI